MRERLERLGVDYEAAMARFMGKTEMYEKFLAKFLDDSHYADAIKAYECLDYEELLAQTHALKGLAGTFGFTRLFDACSDIVTELRKENYEGLDERVGRMQKQYEEVISVLNS